MCDGMPYDAVRGQVHETLKVRNYHIFKVCLLHYLKPSWHINAGSYKLEHNVYFFPFGACFLLVIHTVLQYQ